MQIDIARDRAMHAAMQPFLRLRQANMKLLTKLYTSLGTTPQEASDVSNYLYPSVALSASLAWSKGFAGMMQGLVSNYNEFMVELAMSGMAAMVQSQAALMHKAQEDAQDVIDAAEVRDTAEARGRRMHPAA